jgi:hypothetical protein
MKKQNKVEEIKRSRLTKEQRIELLHQVYDESLIYCATASMDNEFKGTAAAMLMVTRSREELVAMGDMASVSNSDDSRDIVISFEHELPTDRIADA